MSRRRSDDGCLGAVIQIVVAIVLLVAVYACIQHGNPDRIRECREQGYGYTEDTHGVVHCVVPPPSPR